MLADLILFVSYYKELGKNFATTQQKLLLPKKIRLGRRSVFTMDHPSKQFFRRFFTSYVFC